MKRIVSAVLALLSAILLTSCAGKTAVETVSTANTDDSAVTETETSSNPLENLPERDFGGYAFNILGDINSNWWIISLGSEELNGEIINDTVYKRNSFVGERYNVSISVTETDKATTQVRNSVAAGSNDYDMVWERINNLMKTAESGCLVNLYDIGQFDLEADWWDKNSVDAFTISGKLFLACNDINVHTMEGCSTIFFSKTLLENAKLEDLYGLVRDGKWTLDKMNEMMKAVAADTNGSGKRDKGDTFGLVTGVGQYLSLIDGAGQQLVVKEDNGGESSFKLNIASEDVISITEKVCGMLNDKNLTVIVNNDAWGYDSFYADQSLFYIMQLGSVVGMRYNMENDFGIVPSPMRDEAQGYYTTFMESTAQAMCIPITVPDYDLVGVVAETMAIYSSEYLTDAYYDTTLKGKIARDADTNEMLDIMTGTRTFDFSAAYGSWSVYSQFLTSISANGADGLTSLAEKLQSKFDENVAATLEAYASIGA